MDFEEESIERIEKEKKRWRERTLEISLCSRPEREQDFTNPSGLTIARIYTPTDSDFIGDLGFPGQFPYTRGVYPTMYRSRLWTMRQYAGYGTAEESNKRFRYLLKQGQTGISVAFDLPTQMGYDSDHPMAAGEVGKVGVAISTLRDMEILFNQIPLGKISTSMTINSTAMILLAMYLAVAEKQEVERSRLRGTVQNDILKEYVSRGTYIFPPEPGMRLVADIIEFCSKELKHWNSISISGYHMREAGATAVQEIAFTIANAIAYVEAVLSRGIEVDTFAPRLTFFFCAHNDLFEEIAKFRAARRLWAKIMRDRFHARKERSMMLRFHTQTSGVSLTAQQPENNVVRVTIQALAAVLGGTQSLHTNSMDEALALPSERAARLALRTQQILAHETGVKNTVDPIGGSYYLEALTNEIEEKAMKYIEKIDRMGGVAKAIEKGFIQHEIAESAYRYQTEVESGSRVVVGVNEFKTGETRRPELLQVDPEIEERQKARLGAVKRERDNAMVEKCLYQLREAAESERNLFPFVLDSVKSLATLGEISDVLRDVFGRYEESGLV